MVYVGTTISTAKTKIPFSETENYAKQNLSQESRQWENITTMSNKLVREL